MTALGGLAFRRFAALTLLPLGLAALGCRARGDADPDRILADLGDSRWQVRASAAEELGARGMERSIPRLGAALSDAAGAVRAAAAISLGRLHAVSELDRIRSCIQEDPDPQVVVQALYALGTIGRGDPAPRDDVEMLFDKLSDGRRRVRGAARRVLFALVDRRELVAEVRAELQSVSAAERIHGAAAATRLNLPELDDWARSMLADPEPEPRYLAYAEIALHPGRDGSAVLVGGLADPSPEVRKAAAKGLEKYGELAAERALDALVGADPSLAVRQSAADALASIRGISGKALPAVWHFERIDDRLAIEADGSCVLTRSVSLRVDRSVDAVRRLRLVLPPDFPLVSGVTDAAGNPLGFELRWRKDVREIDFEVAPIAAGEAATFRMTARSRRPLYAWRDTELLIAYAPGAIQGAVRELHVEVAAPAGRVQPIAPEDLRVETRAEGQVATLDRLDLAPQEVAKIEVRVATPSDAVTPGRALPAYASTRRELAMIFVVVATLLALLAGAIVWVRRTMGERADRAVLVIALTGGALLLLSPILVEDNLAYYALARSAVLDGDLDRGNEFIEMNQTNAYAPDNRGPLDPVFASIVRAPVLAVAHGFVLAVNTLTPRYAANGFSFPYVFLTAVADFFAVLIGCLACFSLVERRVGRRYGLFAVIAVVTGTNLLLFAYAWTGSSFQPSFLLFAVFLNHWDKTREARRGVDWLGGGVLLGLLGMTRVLNLSFALLPLLDWMHGLVLRLRGKRAPELARHVRDGGLLTAGMLLGYAPQLIVQRAVDDVWVVDAYGVGSGRFSGLRANLGNLFVSREGILSAMPLLALALVGLVLLVRYDRWLGTLLSATLALQLLAIGSYEVYWGMFEFGTPYLVPASPILCLAMASLMRGVSSSSRRLLPALLWGVTALCAWRNGWCMLRQLTTKMLGAWQSEMPMSELLRTAFLLDRKLDVDVQRYSSGFAWLPREMMGALRAADPGQLVAALLWACVVIVPVLLLAWWLRRPPHVRRRLRPRVVFPVLALLWAGLLGWLAVLSSRTNVDYDYQFQEQDDDRGVKIERLEPGASFTWRFDGAYPASRVGLITMLDGAVDAPAGEPVATVRVVAGGTSATFDLRAGVDTADFEIERPESLATRAHAAPLSGACFSWRVRDDSIHYYTARAYCSDFDSPAHAGTTEVTVTSRLARGAVAVLLASAREGKIPRDPSRKRWLAERW